jgi:serine/threonine protein kinase
MSVLVLIAIGAVVAFFAWRSFNEKRKLLEAKAAAVALDAGAVNIIVNAINKSRRVSGGAGALSVSGAANEDVAMLAFSDLVPDTTVAPAFGGFGVVFCASWVSRGIRVAVKMPKDLVISGYLPPAAAAELVKEAEGLVRASDNNVNEFVVKLFGVAEGNAGAAWSDACDCARERHFSKKNGGAATGSLALAAPASNSALAAANPAASASGAPRAGGGGSALLGLVMAWESGGTLADALQPPMGQLRAAWPSAIGDKLRIARELSIGLFHLHRVGIVHGDLKLENVLLSGESRSVRLADFGLADIKSRAEAAAQQHSRVSTALHTDAKRGTWPYMAPEMFGSAHQKQGAVAASRSSDVYALGTLLWELFTGLVPWQELTQGPDTAVDPSAARLALVRAGKTLDISRLHAGTPASVVSLILACLALDRASRPRMGRVRALLEQARDTFVGGRFDVFLSHAWGKNDARKPLTDAIYFALKEHGLRVCKFKGATNPTHQHTHTHLLPRLSCWLPSTGLDSNEMGHNLKASMIDGISKSDVVLALISPDYQAVGAAFKSSAQLDAARAQLDVAKASLADVQARADAGAAKDGLAAEEAGAKVAKLQRSLNLATSGGDEELMELSAAALDKARTTQRQYCSDAERRSREVSAAISSALAVMQAAEVAVAGHAIALRAPAEAAESELRKPLVCCVVEPGMWTQWRPSDELSELAGLSSHLYADATAASYVSWAAEVVSDADQRKLTHDPKALPRILELVAEARGLGGGGGGGLRNHSNAASPVETASSSSA